MARTALIESVCYTLYRSKNSVMLIVVCRNLRESQDFSLLLGQMAELTAVRCLEAQPDGNETMLSLITDS